MSNEMERFLLSVLALTVSWLTARGGTFPTATAFPYIKTWLVAEVFTAQELLLRIVISLVKTENEYLATL